MNWKAFWNGVGSIFNIWGPYSSNLKIEDLPSTEDGLEQDRKALEGDWEKVGKDFPDIKNPFRKENYHG